MTLAAFQQLLAELVLSPELRAAVAEDETALDGAELSPVERRRLVGIAADPRLATATMLHEKRRLAGVATALPATCILLGESLVLELVRDHARSGPPTSFYFQDDGRSFGELLRGVVDELEVHSCTRDVLEIELAMLELRRESGAPAARRAKGSVELPAEARLVELDHDPLEILALLEGADTSVQPSVRPSTALVRLLEDGAFRLEPLHPYLARILRACERSGAAEAVCAELELERSELELLAESGYVVLDPA
jgi:hypothetical protein